MSWQDGVTAPPLVVFAPVFFPALPHLRGNSATQQHLRRRRRRPRSSGTSPLAAAAAVGVAIRTNSVHALTHKHTHSAAVCCVCTHKPKRTAAAAAHNIDADYYVVLYILAGYQTGYQTEKGIRPTRASNLNYFAYTKSCKRRRRRRRRYRRWQITSMLHDENDDDGENVETRFENLHSRPSNRPNSSTLTRKNVFDGNSAIRYYIRTPSGAVLC